MNHLLLGKLDKFVVHYVGNKTNGKELRLSNGLVPFKKIEVYIKGLLNKNFKLEELYRFYFIPELALNPVYQFVRSMFEAPETFIEQSQHTAQYLYDHSLHPQIKSGELCCSFFKDCEWNGQPVEVLAMMKFENKDTFLKIYSKGEKFEVESERGINVNKLDKGCLIINLEEEKGYVVAIVDHTNPGSEAKYWTDDFLHVRPRRDSFNQTQNMLSICKSFVAQMPTENGKLDKANFINRSVEALKEEQVDVHAFAEQVFEKPHLISEFRQFKETYQKMRDMEIDDTFIPDAHALKRAATGTMTTIKLDRNFDINIHGGEQYIVRGYDEEKEMYYYQLFFQEER